MFVKGENLGKLEIANTSPNRNIAFKIRTTQPLCFVVRPNSGVIEANGKATTEIQYVPNEVSGNCLPFKHHMTFLLIIRLYQMPSLPSSRSRWPTQTLPQVKWLKLGNSLSMCRKRKCMPRNFKYKWSTVLIPSHNRHSAPCKCRLIPAKAWSPSRTFPSPRM